MRFPPRRSRLRPHSRRGMTIVVVLGLISIALALSYALMRSQGTAQQVRSNSGRRNGAREAALSGMAAALRKMHQSDWGGVDTTFAGTLSPTQSYTVSFATGDATLSIADPAAAEWPYRVTLVATGSAWDPSNSSAAPSTHKVRAVVRLVPRQLSATPPDWVAMQGYTVYQHRSGPFEIDVPGRVEGRVWIQGTIALSGSYPDYDAARTQYLADLDEMRAGNGPDNRPLSGPVSWRPDANSGSTKHELKNLLGLTLVNIPSRSASDWNMPQNITRYQLYPGGKQYMVSTAPAILKQVVLSPDIRTNPLGIYYATGRVELQEQVQIRGTLITNDDLYITGANVQIEPVALPALDGGNLPVRLPAALVGDDIRVWDTGNGQIRGVVTAMDEFEIREGPENAKFQVQGNVITRAFYLRGRWEWEYGSSLWAWLYQAFNWQKQFSPPEGTPYFPQFMSRLGRKYTPTLGIKPDPVPHQNHWFQIDTPIYVPDPSDPGLRWDLVSWSDSQNVAIQNVPGL